MMSLGRPLSMGIAFALAASYVAAQPLNAPHAAYVYPAGGRQGTTVKVSVGGRFLDGTSAAIVSGRGIRVDVVGLDRPMAQREINDLRDKAQELAKTAKTPAERREIADIRMRIGESLRRNANPTLAEILTLSVTIDADAAPGPRQLRLATALGVSDPVVFCVGQLPEFVEKDEKNSKNDSELTVTLPATVNGRMLPGDSDRVQFPLRQAPQYMPGDVDRYRFAARKGQDLVCIVSARDLMPYLADAVPGWFQAVLTLYDAAGHEIAYDDDYRFQPDPVLHVRIPADGEYVLEIKDALYRGREDFVYRIAIGELPFITSVFPMGGRPGVKTMVQLGGWNLGAARAVMDATKREPGVYSISTGRGELDSNRVPFVVESMPEVFEREPNGTAKEAQAIPWPVVVNGRIQQPGDVDVFAIHGKAGQRLVAEVEARRLGSPLDSSLELTDPQGRRIAFNDDFDDKAAGLLTHQADSHLEATLPADGTYLVRLQDVQRKGGPEYGYRLRVSPPRPDFELRVTPAEINAGAGTSAVVTVHAIRRDGFTGDVALGLRDAPDGFALAGGVVPAGQDRVRLTLTMPPAAFKEPISIGFEGRATIDGRGVTHKALPADDMMQAFAYRHLVPADGLRVSVLQRGGMRLPVRILAPQPLKIPNGGAARVRLALPLPRAFENFQFELSEPPDGVTLSDLAVAPQGAEFVLHADAAKARAGLRGNLIVTVSGERVPPPQGNQPAAARRRLQLITLPAIPFEVTGGRE